MMHKFLARIAEILASSHGLSEMWSALASLVWGIWSLLDPQPLGTLANYNYIASIPESAIDVYCIVCGAAQAVAVYVGRRTWRGAAAFWTSAFYAYLLISFFHAVHVTPGTTWPIMLMAINMVAVMRAAQRLP